MILGRMFLASAALLASAAAMAQAPAAAAAGGAAAPLQQAPAAPPAGTTVPAPGLPILPEVNEVAFDRVKANAAPLTPEQIRDLRRLVDDAERAASIAARGTPRPVSTSVVANLAPGAEPAVVRLAYGAVTNVLFVDGIGNALPITSPDLMKGGFDAFPVAENSNVLKLFPTQPYATGNISVSLKGVSAPVPLMLITGQREVDYRVDVRVIGGNIAQKLAGSGSAGSAVTTTMLEFITGAIPQGAVALKSDSPDVQAWAYNGAYYVKTPLTLLSPAYRNPGKSPDGTSYYEIPPTPIVVVSISGSPKHVKIEAP
ncbi:IcmK-like type IV secretion system protein (plasmid) [Xanthomonas campestris pv. campestris]|uniref:DotH/IcmK family type IV secretion protein n=1 Tax=Xanthomonas campestris TaxID=339 RepID=UPI002367CB08|nr:DotH/IcmK family type IV secretion protein [Xanthomonas campestris]MEB1409516.1 DotH/IcmK family type IV secretion protein [Xanthomonas campestris pv. campestris]MEB1509506.1 DotH/IcmK family type IV secretion protein [Xanthomonas campestris pv. campestris]MEB1763528.1 DotH/IcmK family type IV secretion protein [Xanthomonas campestris pv. campestris]MEB1872804.1 DotH/IcmK family type IV secretion protein [Xanthomonas campestris pv. campestris]MEB1909898.1 DotH/IcmK family type IV secretion 